jgi:YVTN family beta-propeller protein
VISGRTGSVTAIVHGGFPAAFGIAADQRTNTVYLADGADKTWVISGRTNTVTATVRVGNEPLGVATGPQAKAIYVTNNGSNTVTVLTSCRGRAAARCR